MKESLSKPRSGKSRRESASVKSKKDSHQKMQESDGGEIGGLYGGGMYGGLFGLKQSLLELRNRAIPPNRYRQFLKAQNLRERDDLISAIIDTQIEFGDQGFQLYIKNNQARKHYEPIIDEHNLNGLNTQMWESLCTTSNIILHWKMRNGRELEYVRVLNPFDVEVVPFVSRDPLVFVKVPEIIEKLARGTRLSDLEKKLLGGIPQKFLDAAKLGVRSSVLMSRQDKMVLLSNKDGEYWLITNVKGFNDQLCAPTMSSIFASLENRNMLIDGDFSVAYLIKNFIMHVKTGESITTGPRAGSQKNYAERKHLEALKKQFRKTGQAMELYTGHLVNIEYVFPDPKMFDATKYTAPEQRILRWGGVGEILLLGTGANFAAGFINFKRLIGKVKKYRTLIDRVWETFFSHSTIRGDITKANIPVAIYDDSLLKEYSVFVKEMQSLIDRGALSKQTALLKAGFNPDIEEKNKIEELAKGEIYLPALTSMMPIKQAADKISQKNDPGRQRNEVPKSGGTALNAPENPRPSTSSLANVRKKIIRK